MVKSSPAKRLRFVYQSGIFSGKYGKTIVWCFSLCLVLTTSVLIYGYGTIPNVFTSEKIRSYFQNDFLTVINSTESVPNISFSSTPINHQPTKLNNEINHSSINKRLENFRRTHFMTVTGNGRLGNQMFEVASLIGTASRHNYTAFISRKHKLNRYFDFKQVKDVHMINNAVAGENQPGVYNKNVEKLSHDKNWTLSGYFQSWKYFHHCKHEIISSFQFKPNSKKQALEVLKTINAKGRPLIGMHVRRSDMASAHEMRRGYNVATPEYITKALNYFRNITNKPLFLAVSDDRRWTTQHAKGSDVIFVGSGRPEVDMAILSLCNHTIITSGSFGWWGAYLNNGKTVYFSNFPGRNSWLSKQYEPADYYLPEWIGME